MDTDEQRWTAFAHAFERCGFMVTDANMHLWTDADLTEWEAAVDDGERVVAAMQSERSPN